MHAESDCPCNTKNVVTLHATEHSPRLDVPTACHGNWCRVMPAQPFSSVGQHQQHQDQNGEGGHVHSHFGTHMEIGHDGTSKQYCAKKVRLVLRLFGQALAGLV